MFHLRKAPSWGLSASRGQLKRQFNEQFWLPDRGYYVPRNVQRLGRANPGHRHGRIQPCELPQRISVASRQCEGVGDVQVAVARDQFRDPPRSELVLVLAMCALEAAGREGDSIQYALLASGGYPRSYASGARGWELPRIGAHPGFIWSQGNRLARVLTASEQDDYQRLRSWHRAASPCSVERTPHSEHPMCAPSSCSAGHKVSAKATIRCLVNKADVGVDTVHTPFGRKTQRPRLRHWVRGAHESNFGKIGEVMSCPHRRTMKTCWPPQAKPDGTGKRSKQRQQTAGGRATSQGLGPPPHTSE